MHDRKILIIAIARSGHHAVINWLCNRFETKTIFKNNCNQHLQHRNLSVYNESAPGKTVICNFENFDLRGFRHYDWEFDDVIFVNRDPYNLIASTMASGTNLTKPVPRSRKNIIYNKWWCGTMSRYDMIFQHLDQCLGNRDYLARHFYHVNYNRWFTDRQYRKQICKDLGVSFGDSGRDHVPRRGSGSSFDKRKFNGKGSKMDVLNRWKNFTDDPVYNKLVSNPEIKEYSEKYFNFIPEPWKI